MGDHINAEGEFQSDKYPWCKPGFVPLKITDRGAWWPLWQYSLQRREIDSGFADDLQACLKAAGFPAPEKVTLPAAGSVGDPDRTRLFQSLQVVCAGYRTGTVLAAQIDSLGISIAFAASDPQHAKTLIADLAHDMAAAVDRNWQSVKDQVGAIHGEAGHG